MHTRSLKPDMFDVRINGEPSGADAIFPRWEPHDRFGIVVHEPWGAIGASLLIQGAVSEFFRSRRALGIMDIYPEIYAFHVGRDFGDMSMYDFWPYTKEVVVESNPSKVLFALNDRAISRLAIPSGAPSGYPFIWPEELSALDRVRTVIAYSSDGRTLDSDIEIRSQAADPAKNTAETFDMLGVIAKYKDSDLPDAQRWLGCVRARLSATTPEETARAIERYNVNFEGGMRTETYRREDLRYGMGRLIP